MKFSALREWFDYIYIQRSGFFNSAYYQQTYPDNQQRKGNPLRHYFRSGWKEGKNPSAKFDTKFYLKMNPDVKRAGINPLVHYLRYGRMEGRNPIPISTELSRSELIKTNAIANLFIRILKASKTVYQLFPHKIRSRLISLLHVIIGPGFDRLMNRIRSVNHENNLIIGAFPAQKLIDMDLIEPAIHAEGSIAIHIHIFYHDLIRKFEHYLRNMPFRYDLFISISNDEDLDLYDHVFSSLPLCRTVTIQRVLNQGRDIAPLICTFGKELAGYDFIAHLHSKKSAYNKGATEGWLEYLCNNLLGSQDRIRRIFTLMQGEQQFGIVYPQNYFTLPYWANTWLANKSMGQAWCTRLGIKDVPQGYFDFPASSMFWARADALTPLFKAGITQDDFPKEGGQTDGTMAHCLERLFVLCSQKQGMKPGIIRDKTHPSWSAWRFDQYINRSSQTMLRLIQSSKTKLIAFDIFDTLFCRPLLAPESIKKIVSRRIGGNEGHLFEKYRAIAEQKARKLKGRDVGLDDIYTQMGKMSGLTKNHLKEIMKIEEETEEACLELRPGILDLYDSAIKTGKPVIFISDMFLPQGLIEKWLKNAGIKGWQDLFISNEIGFRKDNGGLYGHVLEHYGRKPSEMLMIGDNERSDVQIPCDMSASFLHIMKPGELARGLPRFSNIISQQERSHDIDAEITLGLVVRKNFSPIHYPKLEPASLVMVEPYLWGYSLLGPLLVSFAHWLLEKSLSDGVERLYFLSREGKIIKLIFDEWCKGIQNPPVSEYLVLSRRAVSVAAITSLKDILEIAKTSFYTNTLENFLHTRYGLILSGQRWGEIEQSLGYHKGTEISVVDRDIKQLIPLLQMVENEIINEAHSEHKSLRHYLTDKGMNRDDHQAVVDIGYGGTIQGYLNELLHKKLLGYYMMTDERSQEVSKTHDVAVRACFAENVKKSDIQPTMLKYSFHIEKLLSSDDPQIQYYEMDSKGFLINHFYRLTKEETACEEIRKTLQLGALEYARNAMQIRASLFPDFRPSWQISQMLMDSFLTGQSQKELLLFSKIIMDDHYCGLGLDT